MTTPAAPDASTPSDDAAAINAITICVIKYDDAGEEYFGAMILDSLRALGWRSPHDPVTDAQAISDSEIALDLATWLRGQAPDLPRSCADVAISRAAWLEELADRADTYRAPAPAESIPPGKYSLRSFPHPDEAAGPAKGTT